MDEPPVYFGLFIHNVLLCVTHHRILNAFLACSMTGKNLHFILKASCLSLCVSKILFVCLFIMICFSGISKQLSSFKCNVSAIFDCSTLTK